MPGIAIEIFYVTSGRRNQNKVNFLLFLTSTSMIRLYDMVTQSLLTNFRWLEQGFQAWQVPGNRGWAGCSCQEVQLAPFRVPAIPKWRSRLRRLSPLAWLSHRGEGPLLPVGLPRAQEEFQWSGECKVAFAFFEVNVTFPSSRLVPCWVRTLERGSFRACRTSAVLGRFPVLVLHGRNAGQFRNLLVPER